MLNRGIIKFERRNDIIDNKIEAIMNGLSSLLKLIPLLYIAIISELFASLDVKKITEMNMNNGESRFVYVSKYDFI